MNIEQISSDRLKVVLTAVDLDRYSLDYLSITKDSAGTKHMLKDILFEARQRSGFSLKNSKLLIEVLPGKSDGCVLYLTRLAGNTGSRQGSLHNRTTSPSQRRHGTPNGYILSCGCLDDTIGAINCFAGYPDIPLTKSTLYNLDGKYHLIFMPVCFGLDRTRLESLITSLSEYGTPEQFDPVREAKFAEYGNTISNGRAVESFMRYFH